MNEFENECKEIIDRNILQKRKNTIFAFYYTNPSTKEQILIRGYPIDLRKNNFIIILCENDDNLWFEETYNLNYCEKFTDYSEDAVDKYSSCEGCRYAYGNQLGHMGYGGCISDPDMDY
jgi:hypothetical protein